MRSAKIVLLASLGIVFVAVGVVLSKHPLKTLASTAIAIPDELQSVQGQEVHVCQPDEVVPGGTTAIVVSLEAFAGPSVMVTVRSGSRLITSGTHRSGWGGATVTVPVRAVPQTIRDATVCYSTGPTSEHLAVGGIRSAAAGAAAPKNRIGFVFLGHGSRSWLSLLTTVARRLGLGRAWSGTWVACLVLILILALTSMVGRLVSRELHD